MVFFICIQVLIENYASKQWRPWSDAAFCGIWSLSALFAYVPHKGRLGIYISTSPRWTTLFSGWQILMVTSKECINCIMSIYSFYIHFLWKTGWSLRCMHYFHFIVPFIDSINYLAMHSANACECDKQVIVWFCVCTSDDPLAKARGLLHVKTHNTYNISSAWCYSSIESFSMNLW